MLHEKQTWTYDKEEQNMNIQYTRHKQKLVVRSWQHISSKTVLLLLRTLQQQHILVVWNIVKPMLLTYGAEITQPQGLFSGFQQRFSEIAYCTFK